MEKFNISYNGEPRIVTENTIDKFLILIEDTPLKKAFMANSNITIRSTLLLLHSKHFQGKEWTDLWSYFFSKKVLAKKLRWKEKAFRDLEQKKLKTPKELLRLYKSYKKEYPEDEVNRMLEKPMMKVMKWVEQDYSGLYQYPFFDEKTPKTKVAALEDDLAVSFLVYIKNEWDVELRKKGKVVVDLPTDLQILYRNAISRKPFEKNADGVIEKDGKFMPFKDYGHKETAVRVMVEDNPESIEMENFSGLSADIYDLDQVDRDVMTALLEHRKENFAIDKTIDIRLGDLVRDIYSSDGKKNYDSIRNRLIKLQRIRFTHFVPEEVNGVLTGEVKYREHMGFIDYIKEIITPQGETYMSIVVNQGLHKRFINNQTLKIYKEQIDSLDSRYRSMLYYMQKERINAYHLGRNSIDLTLINFRSNIQFRYSSKSKVIEEISECLDEIIKKNLIVRSYTNTRNQFSIHFEPIGQQEVRDIIGEKDGSVNIKQLLNVDNIDY